MTTLTEFNEIKLKAEEDHERYGLECEVCDAKRKVREIAPKALPALIAVAEGMGDVIVQFKEYIKLMPKGLVGPLDQEIKQALAAFEAWKMQIEGGDDGNS